MAQTWRQAQVVSFWMRKGLQESAAFTQAHAQRGGVRSEAAAGASDITSMGAAAAAATTGARTIVIGQFITCTTDIYLHN